MDLHLVSLKNNLKIILASKSNSFKDIETQQKLVILIKNLEEDGKHFLRDVVTIVVAGIQASVTA